MSAVQIGAMVQQPPEPVAQEFREYPMVLVHPHARRAETIGVPGTEKRDSLGRLIPGVFDQYRGTADFMPPVTVNNYDQEMFHRAQGYERGGNSSHEAFSRMTARGAGPTPEVVEYPKWVDGVLVNDAEQEAALKRMGIDAPNPAPEPTHRPYIEQALAPQTVPMAEFNELKAKFEQLMAFVQSGQAPISDDRAADPEPRPRHVRTDPPERVSHLGTVPQAKPRSPAQIAHAAKLGAAAKARAAAKADN